MTDRLQFRRDLKLGYALWVVWKLRLVVRGVLRSEIGRDIVVPINHAHHSATSSSVHTRDSLRRVVGVEAEEEVEAAISSSCRLFVLDSQHIRRYDNFAPRLFRLFGRTGSRAS